jgi:sialate O-acetylesterase
MKFAKTWSFVAVSFALLAWCGSARAEVKLPKIFSANMVVQQKQPAPVWGWASKGEKVSVALGDSKAEATAGEDGKWSVKLMPPAAGGPYTLTVAGTNTISIPDVLVGEVWVCSGQSNMEWRVSQAQNPAEEAAAGDFPKIRMFTVQRAPAETPQDDCNGSWVVCKPDTVSNFSAVGYFFARKLHQELGVPVGMVNSSWGGTICEAWTSRPTLESDADFQPILERFDVARKNDKNATPPKDFNRNNPNQPSVLYNGMLKPIIPYGVKGAIWYQGESNIGRAEQYAKLFPAMIADWRKLWGQEKFPFIFVQLAPYRYGNNDPAILAEAWEAQLKTMRSVPDVGMAVTTDIGNIKNIHPTNKQEVGRRLAMWALVNTYGKMGEHSGPIYESMTIEGNKIRLKFKHVGGGLVAEGGRPLSHFTIAGEDEKFAPATATIEQDTVVVQSDAVAKPVAVRFAWSDTAEPNFFNKAGLPASPFRTDNFKLLTAGKK